jgi:hypothetical protein
MTAARSRVIARSVRAAVGGIAVALCALVTGGCATTAGPRIGYASWSHFFFSVRANWDQFVGWAPVATSAEADHADREGWWGDEVPTLPAH